MYEKLKLMAAQRANYFCLLDPDKLTEESAEETARICEECGADGLLVGGSLMLHNRFNENLKMIKKSVSIPVLIFPGIFDFVSPNADAILLLSVITGRNPQMLIGEQVRAAPLIHHYQIEAIGTGYMIIESGNSTSVQFMSNCFPLPHEKHDIAVAHALAAYYLGMKVIYMDSGSGAKYPVHSDMIKQVKSYVPLPLIVGGGINAPEIARDKALSGADFIVTGNVLEEKFDPKLIRAFAEEIHSVKR